MAADFSNNKEHLPTRSSSNASTARTNSTTSSDLNTDIEAAFPSRSATDFYDEAEATTTFEKPAFKRAQGSALTTTLTRTFSRVRTADSIPLTPAPDGGARAWATACLAHLVIFNTWGFVNSFGLFQTYYVNELQIGSDSQVAWIGSLQVFILFGVGTASGRATDAGFFKLTFIAGSAVYIFGMFMLSLSRTYWQVFLAQAVCVGLGFGLVFVPSLALVSTYFLKKRSSALGIAVTGSATGGLVFPAIAQRLLPTVGFAWTIRTMALVQLAVAVVCAVFMKPRLPPRKSGPLVEWSAFKELPYTLYLIAAFFFFWGAYIGFFYVGSYGRTMLGTSHSTSINLLLTMNGVGFVGRLVPNILAEKFTGPLNMLIPFAVGAGFILYSWIAVDSVAGLWVFAVVYGITAAGVQGLFPVVLTSLTSNPKKLGVRSGMGFGVVGFAALTGPPIAGLLKQKMNGSFLGMQIFAGSTMMIAVCFLIAARWTKVGWDVREKI